MDLTELRAAIDEVDGELLTLLHRRAEISRMVGAAKKDEGGPVFRPEREQEVVERLLRINRESRGEGLPDEHIARIWREIFSSSPRLAAASARGVSGAGGHLFAHGGAGMPRTQHQCRPLREFRRRVPGRGRGDMRPGAGAPGEFPAWKHRSVH